MAAKTHTRFKKWSKNGRILFFFVRWVREWEFSFLFSFRLSLTLNSVGCFTWEWLCEVNGPKSDIAIHFNGPTLSMINIGYIPCP